MILEFIVSLITLACIVAFVVWLAMQPQKRILSIAVPVCLISFSIIYLFYLVARLVPGDPAFGVPAAFSAFVETFGSFTNGVAYSDIADSDRVINAFGFFWFETFFWALHMLVIVTIAISGFAVFGRKLMDKIRLRLALVFEKDDVYFIYGSTEGALIFGENLYEDLSNGPEHRKPLVVFFSETYDEELRERIAAFDGALIEVRKKRVKTDDGKVEKIDPNYKKIEDRLDPKHVAKFKGLERPSVNGFSVAELLARKAVKDHPPYKTMLQEGGSCEEVSARIPTVPYSAVVVGFGELGRECLKQLIMNAQLTAEKPRFCVINRKAAVFDRFKAENPKWEECAEIDFIPGDIYSEECFSELVRRAADDKVPLRNVYVCCAPVLLLNPADSEWSLEKNNDIMEFLKGLLMRQEERYDKDVLDEMFVTPCIEKTAIWTPDIIMDEKLDKRAIYVHGYREIKEDISEENLDRYNESWRRSRREGRKIHQRSARALADFTDIYLAIAGVEADPKKNPEWGEQFNSIIKANPNLLDALAQIEHRRWLAFQYCNGYEPMGKSTFKERVEKDNNSQVDFSPSHDFERKRHAGLVPWDEMPELDKIFKRYKGEEYDSQEEDRKNVLWTSRFAKVDSDG